MELILTLAVLTEVITEAVKPALAPAGAFLTRYPVVLYLSLLVGVALAAIARADLLAVLEITATPNPAGYVLTGLIIGRGANFVHDALARLRP